MTRLYLALVAQLQRLADLPPLIFRLILAYGFYGPALEKVKHFDNIIQWFGDDLGIPYPELNAYMAVATECAGVVLMTLGLLTRLISIPMIVIMLVAIKTVHFQNGFECSKNGFEVPFYYIAMLLSLLIGGPGRISLDHLLKKRLTRE